MERALTHEGRGREQELLRQQDILARFGELAIRSDDLHEILHKACVLVGEALGTDLAKVMELQEDGITLLVRTGIGWKPGVVGETRVEARKGSSEGYALQTGEPVTSADIDHETRFAYADFLKDNGVKALTNVPIVGPQGQRAYGILEVDSRSPRDFTDADVNFLRTYANLLAAAVQRLRLGAEAKKVEVALRESEDHFRATAELAPQISWIADPQGGVTDFSERWLNYTGLIRESALGEGWAKTVHPEDLPDLSARWYHAVATGESYDAEARVRTALGEFRWCHMRAVPRRDASRRIVRWYGTVEDVEERKRLEATLRQWNESLEERVAERTKALEEEQHERQAAEEKLRQSQKMEAVGQLTGGLAHDFNNLLAGIVGSLDLLQRRTKQGRTEGLDRYVNAAMTSAERAAALTHRLLAFSRRQTLDPKVIEANGVVAGMEDLLRRTAGPSITLETVLTAGLGPVLCDPNQLENVLLNLAINARDAMPEGGSLRVETRQADVEGPFADARDMPPGQYVTLAVTDTGTGMPQHVIDRAFDPFFTTKPLGEGTGLGLSMIYGFAKQSGGQVRIHSKEGMGTTVTLYLPRHFGDLDTQAVRGETTGSRAEVGETVLVVDDEPVVRMLIVEVLQDLGYSAIEAVDGVSGLRQIERHNRFDLLVTDVGLPGGMNGRQLADAARLRHPGLKVLFITGFAETVAAGKGVLDEGMQVMTKPFTMDALATRIRQMIDLP